MQQVLGKLAGIHIQQSSLSECHLVDKGQNIEDVLRDDRPGLVNKVAR